MKDSIRPDNRDLADSRIVKTEVSTPNGVFPRYVALFDYEDGSKRSFDGETWKLVTPSRETTRWESNLFSTTGV